MIVIIKEKKVKIEDQKGKGTKAKVHLMMIEMVIINLVEA
jgi:hypothetical protein